MKQHCAVCRKELEPDEGLKYWVYSPRAGGDKPHYVCERCNEHPKHAAMICANIQRKADAK